MIRNGDAAHFGRIFGDRGYLRTRLEISGPVRDEPDWITGAWQSTWQEDDPRPFVVGPRWGRGRRGTG